MSVNACVTAILTAGGKSFENRSEDDVLDLAARVQARAARLERTQGLSRSDALASAARMLTDEVKAAAVKQKLNAQMNLQKRVELRTRVAARAEQLGSAGKPNIGDALHTEVSALNTPTGTGGNRFSTEAVWKTRVKEYTGGLESDLKRAGVLRLFTSGAIEKQWGRELYERSMRDAGEPHQVGVTGSKEAGQIADIVRKYQLLARERLNREGAWIGDYAGYISSTAHDADAIYKSGEEAWTKFIAPLLDNDRTFEGVENPGKFLKGTWEALSTGVHLSDAVGFKDPAFSGPGNLARRASESRLLHFKDAESWLAYQAKYGTGTLHEQVVGSLNRAARQEALLQRWGTNPRAEFDNTVRWLQEKYRSSATGAVVDFADRVKPIGQLFDVLDGTANKVTNRQAANLGAGLRAIASMSKLGGVMLTHLSSAATGSAELMYHGVGFLDCYANDLRTFLHAFDGPERREVLDLVQAGAEGMHGSMLAPMAMDDTLPGTLSKIQNRFFQLTGLSYVLKGKKDGAGAIMARHLGSMVDKPFDKLRPEVQRGLSLYGIKPDEWEALRTAPDHFQIDGRTFLTPDAAARATGDMSARARDTLALKLRAYYSDVADRYVITPTIADQRYARLGVTAAPGSLGGEAMRFIAQFKTWPIAAARQGLGREINGGQGIAGAVTGIVHLAMMGAVFGYLRMAIRDYSKGLNPRDPRDPETMLAALAQGGGLGILGDYLFGEVSRDGGGFTDTAVGPVAGQVGNAVLKIWNNIKSGTPKDIPSEMFGLGLNNTPFINLFYTRTALNWLFLNSIQESLNPGYLRRAQQNLKRQTGQTYWLSPAEHHLHTFGR